MIETFKEFYEYICTLSPMSVTDDVCSSHRVPGHEQLGITVYDNYTQIDIVDRSNGIVLLHMAFDLDAQKVDCIEVGVIGVLSTNHNTVSISMRRSIYDLIDDNDMTINKKGLEIIKDIFGHVTPHENVIYLLTNPPGTLKNKMSLLANRPITFKQNEETKEVTFFDATNGSCIWTTPPATVNHLQYYYGCKTLIEIHYDVPPPFHENICNLMKIDQKLYHSIKEGINNNPNM